MSEPAPTDSPDPAAPAEALDQLELKLPGEATAGKDIGRWAGVLVLLALVVGWPTTGGPFLWGDVRTVSSDTLLVRPGGLTRMWTGRWDDAAHYPCFEYRPVAFTANWLTYRLGGRDEFNQLVPLAFHVASLLCHALAVVLVWLALRELVVPGAWLVAAIFALHPANIEAVAWVNEGAVPLAGLLFWGSAYTYLLFVASREQHAADRRAGGPGVDPAQTWGLCAGAVVLAALAMLAWPAAGTLPVVVWLGLWWRRRAGRVDLLVLGPLALLALGLWLGNGDLQSSVQRGDDGWSLDLASKAALIGRAFWFALGKVLVPARLSILYPGLPATLAVVRTLPFAAAAAVLAVAYVLRDRLGRGPVAALTAFALCAAASSNWFDAVRGTLLLDPVVYLAMVPLLALVVAAAGQALQRAKLPEPAVPTALGLASVVIIVLGAGALARGRAFESRLAFWRDATGKTPGSSFAQVALAEELRAQALPDASLDDAGKTARADLAEALQHVLLALQIDPDDGNAEHAWAELLVEQGQSQAALPHFDRATQLRPRDGAVWLGYGRALLAASQPAAAIPALDRALAITPTAGEIHRLLGRAYGQLKNPDRAMQEEQQAIDLDPSDFAARQTLAELLADAGKFSDAIKQYVFILADKANQSRTDIWLAIARIKDRQGVYDDAVAYLQVAQKTNPAYPGLDAELHAEQEKQRRAGATRPATRSTTGPTTTESPAAPAR